MLGDPLSFRVAAPAELDQYSDARQSAAPEVTTWTINQRLNGGVTRRSRY